MNLNEIKAKHKPTVDAKRAEWEKTHNTPFYTLQTRDVIKNIRIINPHDINEYIATDGYFALHKVLLQYKSIQYQFYVPNRL